MWIDKQVSLYASHLDKIGRPATYRQILLSLFDKDFPIIYKLRQLEKSHDNQQVNDFDYKNKKTELKSKLQCFAPSALLGARATNNINEIDRTGIMQLDFDYADIQDYDIEELKQCVFNLNFICFCGLSCSGKGFYALALIAEPERLNEYAEHCFKIFQQYGIKVDTSKGRNVNDLRYLSYDANILIREEPEILRIRHFKKKEVFKQVNSTNHPEKSFAANSGLINKKLNELKQANVGSRFITVQNVAYTLGGLGKQEVLKEIKAVIINNNSFAGQENKYLKIADECFKAGSKKPLIIL